MVQEAQKRAARKWDGEHMATIGCKVKKEQAQAIKDHAELMQETVNAFLRRAAIETMERDLLPPDSAPERPEGGGGIHLPPEALKTAQSAAEAAREPLPDFVSRAVTNQAQRDKVARRLGKG